jgi:type I restriction enzyme M protein
MSAAPAISIVLFEGGAGETVRRELLKQADVHTLLRLPTGIFYAQGVKANVLFFDRKPAAEKPWTEKLWIYDLRTNKYFTLKESSSSEIDWRSVSPKGQRCSADQNPLKPSDLDDFVACYNPKNRHDRKESERFKSFAYEELTKRDKLNLDIFWLKDESLEDSANLPSALPSRVPGFPRHTQSLGAPRRKAGALPALDPDIIAAEIVEDLEAALSQFATIAADLKK